MTQKALEILNSLYGYDSFRGHQADIIEHVAAGNNALVLMPPAAVSPSAIKFLPCCEMAWGLLFPP